MRLYEWEALMVRLLSAKFKCHRHYDNGDIIVLVVEEQDFK